MAKRNLTRVTHWIALGILFLLFASGRAFSQEFAPPALADRVDIKITLQPADPFSDGNKSNAKELQVRRGEIFSLVVQGAPKPGFHTYPITQRGEEQDEAGLSILEIKANAYFKPLFPIQESQPEWKDGGKGVGFYLEHEKPFTWVQEVFVKEDAKPGKENLKLHIRLQACDSKCVWGELNLDIPVEITKADAIQPSAEELARVNKPASKAKVLPVPGSQVGKPQEPGAKGKSGAADGYLAFALQGMFWGAISLVTPCVFPMIPITVSYFLKQSEKTHHRPVAMALIYSFTIIVVLTFSAVALLSFFRLLSVHPAMNFGLGLLFVFFALSLLGMYDIELPSGLAHFTSSHQGQGGVLGTIFMALTFTVVSFACVAPFLGGFGGTAADNNLSFLHRVIGGFAFSITFASPFFFLALFPGLLKKLPKSGNWLNSVKVVMGFLELAAAVKFFRAGELVLLPDPVLFTYDFSMALTVVLSVLCGIYLLGFLQLPHDTPREHVGVPSVVLGCLFISLALYLAPSLVRLNEHGQRVRPAGAVFAWVDSFLLPEDTDELPFTGNLKEALEKARKLNQMVFIDFTGVTCTNCKINEANVFPLQGVQELLKKYLLVQLYTDRVPDKFYSAEERESFRGSVTRQREDADKNLKFQKDNFDTEQLPLYVIVRPDASPKGFVELSRYEEGKINDVSAFERFLRQPLKK
ncbi:MAG: hypothetical protein EXR99_00370 [Gemmataceae bacterium]|nr:hypothetical protein [Gemmataceae bacterium]